MHACDQVVVMAALCGSLNDWTYDTTMCAAQYPKYKEFYIINNHCHLMSAVFIALTRLNDIRPHTVQPNLFEIRINNNRTSVRALSPLCLQHY